MSSSNTSTRTDSAWADAAKVLLGLGLPLLLVAANAHRLGAFIIDDAYISFRYARNLTRGLGLVYNPGEAVEGYTNFLWTVLIAGGMKLGVDPLIAAKLLGGASLFGLMTVFYVWSGSAFCLANWLLATAFSFQVHSLLGLEGGLFTFLLVLGVAGMARPGRSVWPAVAFGLAALTRPEAPAYFLIALVLLAREARARQFAVFAAVVGAHYLWRQYYYGAWLPNTLAAKTGNFAAQFGGGVAYLRAYFAEAGPLLSLFAFGAAYAWVEGERRIVAMAALALFNVVYVLGVGADWMIGWRYLMPFEVFAFVVGGYGAKRLLETGNEAVRIGALALVMIGLVQRYDGRNKLGELVAQQEETWHKHARATGRWLAAHGAAGAVALGDIGEVGWLTDWPIFDVLGLVTREVAQLPGGYGHKADSPAFVDAFYRARPRWFVLITDRPECKHSPFAVMRVPEEDARFVDNYDFRHSVRLGDATAWCLFERTDFAAEVDKRVLFDLEEPSLSGWTRYGTAFERGVAHGALGEQQRVIGMKGDGMLNSFGLPYGDRATGLAQSPAFTIREDKIALRIGGGKGFETRAELVVDGAPVLAAFGDDTEDLRRVVWDVRPWRGKSAVLRVIDATEGGWGHVMVDQVEAFNVAGAAAR